MNSLDDLKLSVADVKLFLFGGADFFALFFARAAFHALHSPLVADGPGHLGPGTGPDG